VQQLTQAVKATDEIALLGVTVLPILPHHPSRAVDLSRQTGLLYGDALLATIMKENGLQHLASNDADFDQVTGITRYSPT
jgi:predicted nucleic acid-binding protein